MADTQSKHPELDKMAAVRGQSQAIGEFLDEFLPSKGWVLAEVPDYYDHTLVPVYYSIEELLAEYFGIDLDKVERERRAILDELSRSYERESADPEGECSGSPSLSDSPS